MADLTAFKNRYVELEKTKPSIIASGFWFTFVFLIWRLIFLGAFAGLVITILWALHVIKFDEPHPLIINWDQVRLFFACLFTFIMLISGFSARMSKRIVVRNAYIAELEMLIEETLLREPMTPGR